MIRVPLWLPPLTMYLADIGLTLAGQPVEYWAGNYSLFLEANPAAAELLAIHPAAVVAAAVVWAMVFVSLVRTGRPWAVVIAFLLTVGHAIGAAGWLTRFGPGGWVGAIGLFVLAERLWSQSRLTGQPVVPNSTA